jgi:acetyl-CoA carboxylase biotin carboxylase subunit
MKVLVANRGEIAVRIIRACRELGLGTVAVFSECDRTALHTRLADEAWRLGPSPAADSYLRIDKIVAVARRSGAALVHPGYGFLAENAGFAQACVEAGVTFVGPRPDAIRTMGSKTAAREEAARAGVPIVPGSEMSLGAETPVAAVTAEAARVGFPLLVKAVAGGGGKGMRMASGADELEAAIRAARSEAAASFGDSSVYLERRLDGPRHVEVQILADDHGAVVPFVERECSIQRRHQKVVEESPAMNLDRRTRQQMADAAVRIARAVRYSNAGTIEFLLDRDGRFYFLEMNTRLQVEHPVTEAVTGIDLVRWQLRIALGDRLTISEEQALTPNGHAIECRIYAEDPDRGFLPAPGLIRAMTAPGGPGIREDRGVSPEYEVPVFYDSLVSKLIAWGRDRPEALTRLTRALAEYRLVGLTSTVPFFQWLVQQPDFVAGRVDTTYLDRVLASRDARPFVIPTPEVGRDAAVAAALAAWFRAHRASAAPGTSAAGAWRAASRRDALR